MTTSLFHYVGEIFTPELFWSTASNALALSIASELSLQAYRLVLFLSRFAQTEVRATC